MNLSRSNLQTERRKLRLPIQVFKYDGRNQHHARELGTLGNIEHWESRADYSVSKRGDKLNVLLKDKDRTSAHCRLWRETLFPHDKYLSSPLTVFHDVRYASIVPN